MAPKKTLIKPEKTTEAAEKEKQASAKAQAEGPTLQDVDDMLSVAEATPEKLEAAEKETGVDYSFEVENATVMRTGIKKLTGKPVLEEEDSLFREQAPSLKEEIGESLRKENAEKTPEERAKTAKRIRKVLGPFLPKEFMERMLVELNVVDSEAPSEPDKENA